MGFFSWWNKLVTDTPNSVVVDTDFVTKSIKAISPNCIVDDEYSHFLCFSEISLINFVEKYHDNSYITYGADAPDFPLCYDFAQLCEADIRKGAIKEGLKERPAFGVLRYTRHDCRHAINFAVLMTGKIKYFEPQSQNQFMDIPEDLVSLDNFFI